MADDDEVIVEAGEGSGSSKKKLIILALVALLVLGGAGGGAYWFFVLNAEPEAAELAEGEEAVEGEDGEESEEDSGGLFSSGPGKAIYHKLRPKFVTTFEANNRQRYMQVEVTLVTRDSKIVDALITHQPLLRNALVMLFAEQDYLELQTQDGKERLRKAARTALRNIMKKESGSPGIDRVLFTEFVLQ